MDRIERYHTTDSNVQKMTPAVLMKVIIAVSFEENILNLNRRGIDPLYQGSHANDNNDRNQNCRDGVRVSTRNLIREKICDSRCQENGYASQGIGTNVLGRSQII